MTTFSRILRNLLSIATLSLLSVTTFAPAAHAGLSYSTNCGEMPLMTYSKAAKTDPVCAGICINKACGKVSIECFNECIDVSDQPGGVCYPNGASCGGATPFQCGAAVCATDEQACAIAVKQMASLSLNAFALPQCSAFSF